MQSIIWKTAKSTAGTCAIGVMTAGFHGTGSDHANLNFGESTMATPAQIETITKHYLIALLWTMPDDEDWEHPGDGIAIEDLPPETIENATNDVVAFVASCCVLFDMAMQCYDNGYGQHLNAGSAEAALGYDFALTRNGHGTGFWDRDSEGLPRVLGEALTRVCEAFPPANLYIGDDGKAYF